MPEDKTQPMGAAAGKDAAVATPSPEGARGGRHVTAGPKATLAMARLLGLGATAEGWRLEGLCGQGEENVRLSLANGGHRLVFDLRPRSAREAQVRAPGLSLAAEGGGGPAVRRFLEAAASRLGDRGLDDVLRMIEADPRSFVEQWAPGQDGDRIKVPCIGQPIGLLEAGWRNFYADQDFEVLLGVPHCSSNKTVNIQYADIECYYARPKLSFRKWTFLDWPEEDKDEDLHRDGGESNIVTELEERDMILGTGERADAVVEEVRKNAAAGKFLLFTHLCTPIVMGEDFQGLARRCEKEVGGTAVRWSQKDRDQNDNFGEHFRSLLGRPGFFEPPGDPMAVNLFHFPKRCREAEILPFLEGIGVKTNVCAFPDVDFPSLENLPKAVWQVFCERSSYPTKVRELLAASPRPVVSVRAPYGLEGTGECLRGIAAATGKEKDFEAAWGQTLGGFLPSWEKMRQEAAGRRLAFVVSETTLPRLLGLRYGFGAPLAGMIREMGFGMELLYYERHGQAPEIPEGLRGSRITVFRSPWELERALRQGGFEAVYSDVFFDWRITRAGKARFSSKDFEMGLEGARRTFQRLLAVCRLPFYRRYAQHLARVRRKDNV